MFFLNIRRNTDPQYLLFLPFPHPGWWLQGSSPRDLTHHPGPCSFQNRQSENKQFNSMRINCKRSISIQIITEGKDQCSTSRLHSNIRTKTNYNPYNFGTAINVYASMILITSLIIHCALSAQHR